MAHRLPHIPARIRGVLLLGAFVAGSVSAQTGRQQATDAQRQVDQVYAMYCKSGVESLMSQALRPDSQYHCAASFKAEFCKRLQTPEGFALVANRAPTPIDGIGSGDLKEGAEFCGVQHEEISARVCQRAESDEALDVLAKGCVARGYGRTVVLRECAGRNFSSPPADKYRNFCSAVAMADPSVAGGTRQRKSAAASGGAVPSDAVPVSPQVNAQAQAIERGKQLLKGLLGR